MNASDIQKYSVKTYQTKAGSVSATTTVKDKRIAEYIQKSQNVILMLEKW